MEPKLIKEENANVDKDNTSGYNESPRTRSKASKEQRCKTPDSPESARQAAPASPGRCSPPARHPPTNGLASPLNNGSNDSLTPPLPAAAAAAPLPAGLEGQAHHFGHSYAASVLTRPLVKVKRFLSTLVQFGNEIGPDIGERVRSLVHSLVSSNLSIEEFHHSLQDVTNFPLRAFVLPFLRTHLPLLQREIHNLARSNKQSPLQYIRSHDHTILDSAHSPSELAEIFMPNDLPLLPSGIKRRASDSIYENGLPQAGDIPEYLPLKRPAPSFLFHTPPNGLLPPAHPFDYQHARDEPTAPAAAQRGDEEWRNIHVMLNCILSMVEKTKRALTILQQRSGGAEAGGEWLRRTDVSADLKRAANEIMQQAVRQTEERVAEVRRRAEEAVNEVKRQAVGELQKAVAAAEGRANELVAAERAKLEKEVRKEEGVEGGENSQSPPVPVQPQPSQQNSCWNCGRKAHETCSGCSVARYCGPFCQHKDWENHHQICAKDKGIRPLRAATPSTTLVPASADPNKFKK